MKNVTNKLWLVLIIFLLFIANINAINDTELSIGAKVKYKDILFYVIGNSDNQIKLLKAEPLTYDDVTIYGKVGTDEQRVNMYMDNRVSATNYRKVINQAGYGGMAYLSNDTCGFDDDNNFVSDGCTNDYDNSDVKYIVDSWVNDKINFDSIIEARIPFYSEFASLGFEWHESSGTKYLKTTNHIPSWIYNGNYYYWVINDNNSSSELCGMISASISCHNEFMRKYIGVVRPVLVVNKEVKNNINIIDNDDNKETNNNFEVDDKNEKADSVSVPNTMKKSSVVFIVLGIIIIGIGLFLLIKNKKVKYMFFIAFSIIIFNKKVYAYNSYEIGQVVNLNGMDFYVIKNSDSKEDYVTALKKEPLTKVELERYGEGHLNRYTQWNRGNAYSLEYYGVPYGGITYYSSEDCGYRETDNGSFNVACTNDYNASDIKYVVDNWSSDIFNSNELKEVDNYKARLLTVEELNDNLDCKKSNCNNSKYSWLIDSYYGSASTKEFYWTMSGYVYIYYVEVYTIPLNDIASSTESVYDNRSGMVRPVVNIYKRALGDTDTTPYITDDVVDNVIDLDDLIKYAADGNEIANNKDDNTYQDEKNDNSTIISDSATTSNKKEDNKNEKKEEYIVSNTYKRLSILGICIGIILVSLSTIVILKNKKLYK